MASYLIVLPTLRLWVFVKIWWVNNIDLSCFTRPHFPLDLYLATSVVLDYISSFVIHCLHCCISEWQNISKYSSVASFRNVSAWDRVCRQDVTCRMVTFQDRHRMCVCEKKKIKFLMKIKAFSSLKCAFQTNLAFAIQCVVCHFFFH